MVNITTHPVKNPVTHRTGSWVGPSAGWTFEKRLAPTGNKTVERSAFSLVTILTELSRFYKRKPSTYQRPGVEVASCWLKGICSKTVRFWVASPVLSLHCFCGYFKNPMRFNTPIF